MPYLDPCCSPTKEGATWLLAKLLAAKLLATKIPAAKLLATKVPAAKILATKILAAKLLASCNKGQVRSLANPGPLYPTPTFCLVWLGLRLHHP